MHLGSSHTWRDAASSQILKAHHHSWEAHRGDHCWLFHILPWEGCPRSARKSSPRLLRPTRPKGTSERYLRQALRPLSYRCRFCKAWWVRAEGWVSGSPQETWRVAWLLWEVKKEGQRIRWSPWHSLQRSKQREVLQRINSELVSLLSVASVGVGSEAPWEGIITWGSTLLSPSGV